MIREGSLHTGMTYIWNSFALLKIDTEGFDIRVIEGGSNAISQGQIDMIVAECTFNPRGAPHVDALELIELLRAKGFEVVAVYSENVGMFVRGSGYCDILFAKSKGKLR